MTSPTRATLVEEVALLLFAQDNGVPIGDAESFVREVMPSAPMPRDEARAILSLIASRLSDVTPEMVEVVAEAMHDAEFGYDLNLIRLVDGVSTYRLTYSDGTPPIEFDDMDEAYAHIAAKKRSAQARAAISAFLAASPLTPGETP